MQRRFGPMRATLLLGRCGAGGILYALAWFAGGGANGVLGLGLFVVFTTGLDRGVHLVVEQHRREPLLQTILLHGSVDGTATYLQVLADRGVIPADAAAFSVEFGVLIVAVLTALALIALTWGASDRRRMPLCE